MLEIFLTVGIAYIFKRFGLFSSEHSKVLVNYVLYFALPQLSFKTAYNLGFSKEVAFVSLGAWMVIISSIACAYLIGRLIKLDKQNLRSLMVVSAFGNTAFLGYPYTFSYFGSEGLRYAVIYDSMGSFLAVSSLGFLIIKGGLNLRSVLFFPPFLGLVFGFLLRGFSLPEYVWKFVDFSVASLLPVVLFSLGLSFELSHAGKGLRLLIVALGIKMFLSPLLAVALFKLLPLSPLAYKVSVLESAMPTMITASLLMLKYGLNHNLAFASAGIGMLLSFLSIPLWVFIIKEL
ncbi:MAG: AEC family transporter [Aquificota bacterium]|jgi:predicted permease|nr:AEC family transporter [Aquificaceae bacterium]HAV39532.1 transporter [Aquificaceae bacterium]HCO38525.1 transporter [Aquificaceae bacterium]